MKKSLWVLVGVSVLVLTGCKVHYQTDYGFGSTMPGVVYSYQTRGTFMLPKAESMEGVEVLGPVEGESTELNVLLLVAVGNGGIEAAKKDALKRYPDADDILNVEVDTRHFNVLPIFNESTTILRGIAVKYKKK